MATGSKKKPPRAPVDSSADDSIDDVEIVYERTTIWEDLRDFYFTFDRRTLGMSRILIGIFLMFDLFRRTPDWLWMYSNEGVLPTHYNLWRPQAGSYTFFNAFAERQELYGLWLLGFFIYLFYIVGYKTRVVQVLAAIFVASMNGRVLLIENGGYVVHNLLMLWTAFLPFGDRFSVDSWISSFRTQRENGDIDLNDRSIDVARWRLAPHVTVVSAIILIQLCAVYGFNVVHKTGPAWHNGTAVHFVLYVDRMVNPLIGATRDYIPDWGIIILTKSVMGMEAGMSLALLSPLARAWARRIAILFLNLLHIGFGSTFVLGPFAWALCCFSLLLFGREDWEIAFRTMKRRHRRRTVHYDPQSHASFFWCRVIKRLDRFELLTFEADPNVRGGLEVTAPSGERVSGASARAAVVSALPLGPLAPLSVPGLGSLLDLPLQLGARLSRSFWPKDAKRAYDPERIPAGYQPELRDDAGGPTIDGAFMHKWITEFYRDRLLKSFQPILGAILMVLGIFVGLYLAMLLKSKLEVNIEEIAFGSYTRARALYYAGVVVFLGGAYLATKPFIRMNVLTPAAPWRRAIRVRSWMREAVVLVFAMGAMNQGLVELWVFSKFKLPQPPEMRYLSHKLRYLQGWFMFSPNPVMDDGIIVCDAVTVDGRRVDPFSIQYPPYALAEPDFDLLNASSFQYSQIWSDYFNRMHLGGNTSFRKPMKEFIFRLPERTGNPNDAIVKGTVYWVHDMNPRFTRRTGRQITSFGYNRKELFKFSNPDDAAQSRWRELGAIEPPEAPLPVPLPEEKLKDSETNLKTIRPRTMPTGSASKPMLRPKQR